MSRADDWRGRGGHFSWRPAAGNVSSVEVFHVEIGDPGAPVVLLMHGWPTSSIDWYDVAAVSNGNIFLPLSNLTQAQQLMLDPQSWPHVSAALTPSAFPKAWAP